MTHGEAPRTTRPAADQTTGPRRPRGGRATARASAATVRGLWLERLEPRRLLSSIAGVAFQDRDGDGTRDANEPGLSGRTIYIDTNDNGLIDSGERTATTATDGSYAFNSLPAGNYTLRQVVPAGWGRPASYPREHPVILAAGETTTINLGSTFDIRAHTGTIVPPSSVSGGSAYSLALSGTTAVIGVRTADGGRGAAYVYNQNPLTGAWTLGGNLAPADLNSGSDFGARVAISGGSIFISAPGAGAGYVDRYVLSGQTWSKVERLEGLNLTVGAGFGSSLSSGTDRIAVIAGGVGHAYVYTKAGDGSWGRSSPVIWNPCGDAWGGYSDIDGNLLAVGATSDGNLGSYSGAVFVYAETSPGEWTFKHHVKHPEGKIYDHFGSGIQLKDGLLYAAGQDDALGVDTGAVYVFNVSATSYSYKAKLNSSSVGSFDILGCVNGTSVSGDLMALGAGGYDWPTSKPGAVVLFQRDDGGTWREHKRLAGVSTVAGDALGREAVVADGDLILANAPGDDGRGTVLVFDRILPGYIAGTTWQDRDGDGVREAGEPVVSGRTVYLDADDDGVLDAGEVTAVTDAGGSYEFQNLLPGSYVVRQVVPANWTGTAPSGPGGARRLTVSAGQTATGADFGSAVERVWLKGGVSPAAAQANAAMGDGSVSVYGDVAVAAGSGDGVLGASAGAAHVFTRDGAGQWSLTQTLRPAEGEAGDRFGIRASVHGEYMVIGAPGDDDRGANAGAVYVYRRVAPDTWVRHAKLTAGDAAAGDEFGDSVLIDGQTIVVGAAKDDDRGTDSGSVYVFRLDMGDWVQTAKVTAADGQAGDAFGSTGALALSGGTLVVGAYRDDDRGADSGSVYIFAEQANGSWTQSAKLLASDGTAGDWFGGWSLSLEGSLLLVSAYTTDQSGVDSGSVYAFRRDGAGVWSQAAKLVAPGLSSGDWFGISLAVSGNLIAIGAGGDDNGAARSGSVHLYRAIGDGTFAHVAKLASPNPAADGYYGTALDLDGQTLSVSAWGEPVGGQARVGRVMFYDRAIAAYLNGTAFVDADNDGVRDAGEAAYAGRTVYLDANDNGLKDAGEAECVTDSAGGYKFDDLTPGAYVVRLVQADETSQTLPGMGDGWRVTLSPGQTLSADFGIVSAATVVGGLVWNDRNGDGVRDAVEPALAGRTVYWDANDNGVLDAGEKSTTSDANGAWSIRNVLPGARVFRQVVPGWWSSVGASIARSVSPGVVHAEFNHGSLVEAYLPLQALVAPDGQAGDGFGHGSISIGGSILAVGAHLDDGGRGAVYIYEKVSGRWQYVTKLVASDLTANAYFGMRVALSADGSVLATGAHGSDAFVSDGGAGYVFKRQANGSWVQEARLAPGWIGSTASMGESVAITADGRYAAFGMPRMDQPNVNSGQAALFWRNDSGTWGYWGTLRPYSPPADSYFGAEIAITGNDVLVSAIYDSTAGYRTGRVFHLDLVDAQYYMGSVQAGDPDSGDVFGQPLVASGSTMVVGAMRDDGGASDGGAAYVFEKVGGSWVQRQKLVPTGLAAGEEIPSGYGGLAVGPSKIAIGSYNREISGAASAGFVYLYARNESTGVWSESQRLAMPFGTQAGAKFGAAMAFGPADLVVTAPGWAEGQGAAYVMQHGRAAYVRGSIFQDTNNSGARELGEGPLAGRVVYLDLNDNGSRDGTEPQLTTDASGLYEFQDLSPGSYVIRQVPQGLWAQTQPASDQPRRVSVGAGETVSADFGFYATATVSGRVFSDANGNGTVDGADAGMAGWVVFADLDGDRVLDAGERTAVTDASGNYVLSYLPVRTVSIDVLGGAAWVGSPRTVELTQLLVQSGIDLGSVAAAVSPPPGNPVLRVTGRLAVDEDGNDVVDGYELEGVSNVQVKVWRDDGDGVFEPGLGDVLSGTATTDAGGQYALTVASGGGYWSEVVTGSAGMHGRSLYGRATVRYTAAGAQQASGVVDFSVLSAFVVSITNDEFDSNFTAADLSLREAVFQARVRGAGLILFEESLAGGVFNLSAGRGQLSISSAVSILGPVGGAVTIQSAGNSRLLYVESGLHVEIKDVVLSGGSATSGGALYVSDGATVLAERVTVRNSVASSRGGGVYVASGGVLTMRDVLVQGNSAGGQGGGVYADVESAVTMERVTVAGNTAGSATGDGGGIYAAGLVTGRQVTVSGNVAGRNGGGVGVGVGATADFVGSTVTLNRAVGGAGVWVAAGAGLALGNTIVAGNATSAGTPADVAGTVTAGGGFNVIGSGAGGVVGGTNGNVAGTAASPVDARLWPLAMYGGRVPTHALRWDSPANEAGSSVLTGADATDAAGNARLRDYDADGTARVDVGAFESAPLLTVESLLDEGTDTDGKRSLREALAAAALSTGPDLVRFSPGLSVEGMTVVPLGAGELVVTGAVFVDGAGGRVTLSGAGAGRVMNVPAGAWLSLAEVTVTGGNAVGDGGAVLVAAGGRMDVERALFVSNTASGAGGAVASAGTVSMANVTFAGNEAGGSGGAVATLGGTLWMLNVTASGNRAASGGGVAAVAGSVTLGNTVVAGNARPGGAADDVAGVFAAGSSFNFLGTASGSTGLAAGAGTKLGDPGLTTLAYTGGSHATFGVRPASPVVDAGSDALAAGLGTDARGLPRVRDGDDDGAARVDVGAFEQQYPLNQSPTISTVSDLGGAVEGVAFELRHDLLLAASDAEDADNVRASLGFRVEAVLAGTLTMSGQPVLPGVTVLRPGETLVWTPPAGLTFEADGTALVEALRVRADDGTVASLGSAAVRVRVTTVASPVNYAVLFSGGDTASLNYPVYYANVRRTFEVLVNRYGLRPENIAVVYADGRDPGADQPGGVNSELSFAPNVVRATRSNLRGALTSLAAVADANDHLFFWTYDHGLGDTNPARTGEEVLRGWGGDAETVTGPELRVWLQGLSAGDSAGAYGVPAGYQGVRAGFTTYVMGQCFAGGLLDDLVVPGSNSGNRFGASAANHYEASYGDYFVSAFTDALAAGLNRTRDAFAYAYARDGRAQAGYFEGAYAPNAGQWRYDVEHPWMAGGDFPMFAVSRSQANATPVVHGVTPVKASSGASEIELTYDLLKAAVDASDPAGQSLSYRVTGVDQGTLWRDGVQLGAGDLPVTVSLGGRLTWKPPANAPQSLNALRLRPVAADGATTGSDTVLPVRFGVPGAGPVAQADAFSLRPGVVAAPLAVLGNDLGTGLQVVRFGQATSGSVRVENGLLLYTPAPEFTGTDRFTYVVRDGSGATDLASVTVSVRLTAGVGAGLPAFRATPLGLPSKWAEMPTTWSPAFRATLPEWKSSFGLDLTEAGETLVAVRRDFDIGNPATYFPAYVGGSQASYRWTHDALPPYWNWNAGSNVMATNTRVLTVGVENSGVPDSVPNPERDALRALPGHVYGFEAASLANPFVIPGRVYVAPDGNMTETGQPTVGAMLVDPGTPGEVVVPFPNGEVPVAVSASVTDGPRYLSLLLGDADLSGVVDLTPTAQLWWVGRSAGDAQALVRILGTGGARRSSGEALLADGDVVGTAETAQGFFSAYHFDRETGALQVLASPMAGRMTAVLAANTSGVAVGVAAPQLPFRDALRGQQRDLRVDRGAARAAGSRAVQWQGGTATDLGTLSSDRTSGWAVAYDVNEDGTVVGASNGRAFLVLGGTMYDLNELVGSGLPTYTDPVTGQQKSMTLVSGDSVNNAGQVLATLDNRDGTTRAVFLDLSSALEVTPDSAQAFAKRPVTIRPLDNDRGASFLVSVTQPAAGRVTLEPATNTLVFDPVGQFDDLRPGQTRSVSFSYSARDAFGASASGGVTLLVSALGTFHLASTTLSSAGVGLRFSAPPVLHKVDLSGPAVDLILTGPSGVVRGSLVAEGDDGTALRFVPRGGSLPAGTYTLTLRSGPDGFTSAAGAVLDGDADDVPGGDSVQTLGFAESTGASVVVLPIARAPGQALGVPSLPGWPVSLRNVAGARAASFVLEFDPAMLNVTSVVKAAGLPDDWTLTAGLLAPGRWAVGLFGVTPLSASLSPTSLVRVVGSVPATAPANALSLVRVRDVVTSESAAPGEGATSVLVTAAPGDATGNNGYSAEDASLVSRVATGLDAGFAAFPLADPWAVGDATGDGTLTVLDAADVLAAAAGAPPATLPPPAGQPRPGVPAAALGLSLAGSVSRWNTTLADLAVSVAAPASPATRSLDLRWTLPAGVTVASVAAAPGLAGWTAAWSFDAPTRTLRVSLSGTSPLPAGTTVPAATIRLKLPVAWSRLTVSATASGAEGVIGPASASVVLKRPPSSIAVPPPGPLTRATASRPFSAVPVPPPDDAGDVLAPPPDLFTR